MWSLRAAQRAIVVAGCLGTAYTQLTLSAAAIDYTRRLGGGGLHIGIWNALPTGMLFMQFLAALVANHLQYRRRLWMTLSIVQRLLYVPVVCGPWLFPDVPDSVWMWSYLSCLALEQGLLHFCTPLWLSWMGDYLPHRGLNEYWGVRQLWMQWTAAGVLCAAAVLLYGTGVDVRVGFPALVVVGSVLGVADVLLFRRVAEPPVARVPNPDLRQVLLAPLRHPGFRSFIGFMCFWHFAAMVGASFISLFLLKVVGMSLFQVLLLWACSWTGGAMFSRRLGLWAERFGNKPVLVLCTIFKSVLMLSLLVVPGDPTRAFWFLLPVFMFDAALNTGFAISTNGFLLKHSPAENRTMFIASGTALAGIVGGATSIAAGAALSALGDWRVLWGDYAFGGFHLMFTISIVLRLVSVALVARIQEPHVYETVQVVTSLIGVTPLRVIRYPIGLYRSISARAEQALRNGTPLGVPVPEATAMGGRAGAAVPAGSPESDLAPPAGPERQSGTRDTERRGSRVPFAVALAAAVRWPSQENRQVAATSDSKSPELLKKDDGELARAGALE